MNIKVKSCSCFFEQCVWLTMQSNPDVEFDKIAKGIDLFVKEKQHHFIYGGSLLYVEYLISCIDCFTFQLWNLTIENIRIFDTVDCQFTFSDTFNFGEEFHDDVFIGNNDFFSQNHDRKTLEQMFIKSNIADHFFRQPKHKSCFASLSLCRYRYFCSQCRNIYCHYFEQDLHFYSVENNN